MKQHLNLLPWKLRCRLLLRRRLREWSTAWMLLAALLTAWYGWECQGVFRSQQLLSVAARRASTVQSIDTKNQKLRQQIDLLNARLAKYGHLQGEQLGFQLLATISHSSRYCAGRIQIQKMTFSHTQVAAPPAPQGTDETEKFPTHRDVRKLSLSGVAKNNLTIAQFVTALRDAGVFQAVDLKSSQGNVLADAESRTYHLECSF